MKTKRLALLLACALCAGLFSGCGQLARPTGPQRYSATFYDVFDTVTTVIAYCDTQAEFDAHVQALYDDLLAYHKLYDIYNDYEGLVNLKTVNETAAQGPITVDGRILDMLTQAKEMYAVTAGKTNVAMGQVFRLWHDSRESADANGLSTPPEDAALAAAAAHGNMENLVLDAQTSTVYFADPEMTLDVGSCGKGYACEMAARSAEARGMTSALLNVGGSLRAIGTKPDGSAWTGGVEVPWDDPALIGDRAYISAVQLADGESLVISGNYQRYFTDADGVRYHHLIDPDTLQPARYCSSVSVLTKDAGLADCLSTGLFCLPVEDGMALAESLENVEVLWCLADGTTVQTSGWAAHELQ